MSEGKVGYDVGREETSRALLHTRDDAYVNTHEDMTEHPMRLSGVAKKTTLMEELEELRKDMEQVQSNTAEIYAELFGTDLGEFLEPVGEVKATTRTVENDVAYLREAVQDTLRTLHKLSDKLF